MTYQTNSSPSHEAGKPAKQSSLVARRAVGAVLFTGGLVICGNALYQPADDSLNILLTNGTTGASGDTSGGTSGNTSGTTGESSGSSGESSGGTSGNTS